MDKIHHKFLNIRCEYDLIVIESAIGDLTDYRWMKMKKIVLQISQVIILQLKVVLIIYIMLKCSIRFILYGLSIKIAKHALIS